MVQNGMMIDLREDVMSYPVMIGTLFALGCAAGMAFVTVMTLIFEKIFGTGSGSILFGILNIASFVIGGSLAGNIVARVLELGKKAVIGLSVAFSFLCMLLTLSLISLMQYNGVGDLFQSFVVVNGLGFFIAGLIIGLMFSKGIAFALYSALVFGVGGVVGGVLFIIMMPSSGPTLLLVFFTPLVSVYIGGNLLARKL
jgi:hypothetical protein